jgi:hypothetical protein
MKKKYYEKEGELAYRMWLFACAVEEIKKTPNPEKKALLRAKLTSFSAVAGETGGIEMLSDVHELIKELG